MIALTQHDRASCPECGHLLYFGVKENPSVWKVYYECTDSCGFHTMAGKVDRAGITHLDEVHERAQAMGDRWS
jgi:hypothetical protein